MKRPPFLWLIEVGANKKPDMSDQNDLNEQRPKKKTSSKPLPEQEDGRGRRDRVDNALDRRQSKQQLKRWMRDFNLDEDDFDWDAGGDF